MKEVKRKSLFSALPTPSFIQFFAEKIAAKKRTKVEEKYDVKIDVKVLPSLAYQSSVEFHIFDFEHPWKDFERGKKKKACFLLSLSLLSANFLYRKLQLKREQM